MSTVVSLSVPGEVRTAGLSPPGSQIGTRFHLSLNVSSIERVAAFLQLVLGAAPVKLRSDYAKFELDSPPLVLSLEPNTPNEAGALNHLGFRFANTADLLKAQQRIEAAGISTQREEGVECCYSKQTKFWVHDPDQRLWEFYVLEGDLEHRGGGQTREQIVGDVASCSMTTVKVQPVVFEHRMGSPFELPATPSDQIRLRGTFNVPTTESEMDRVIREVYSHLKPGGLLELHMLTSESPLDGPIELPVPAAHVRHVPVRGVLMQKVADAGFADIRLTTFRSKACFQSEGKPLRETKVVALKPAVELATDLNDVQLVYKGPFAEVCDDLGEVWRRGELKSVSAIRWEQMKQAGIESFFTLIPRTTAFSQCGT